MSVHWRTDDSDVCVIESWQDRGVSARTGCSSDGGRSSHSCWDCPDIRTSVRMCSDKADVVVTFGTWYCVVCVVHCTGIVWCALCIALVGALCTVHLMGALCTWHCTECSTVPHWVTEGDTLHCAKVHLCCVSCTGCCVLVHCALCTVHRQVL